PAEHRLPGNLTPIRQCRIRRTQEQEQGGRERERHRGSARDRNGIAHANDREGLGNSRSRLAEKKPTYIERRSHQGEEPDVSAACCRKEEGKGEKTRYRKEDQSIGDGVGGDGGCNGQEGGKAKGRPRVGKCMGAIGAATDYQKAGGGGDCPQGPVDARYCLETRPGTQEGERQGPSP